MTQDTSDAVVVVRSPVLFESLPVGLFPVELNVTAPLQNTSFSGQTKTIMTETTFYSHSSRKSYLVSTGCR
jgi:hypothetical protein